MRGSCSAAARSASATSRSRTRAIAPWRAPSSPTSWITPEADAPTVATPLLLGLQRGSAVHPLPRRGVGRAVARRSPALRVPGARGRAGGSQLADDPEQARALPDGLR